MRLSKNYICDTRNMEELCNKLENTLRNLCDTSCLKGGYGIVFELFANS